MITETEWSTLTTALLELGITIEDVNILQKKMLPPKEETKHTTVEEFIRDTEDHILSDMQYATDDELKAIIRDNNLNANHLQYLKIALEDY